MSSVRKLSVKGFKSIQNLDNFELYNLNVLIGANGAGKSNFISLFKLVNEIYESNLTSYVAVQGGPDTFLYGGRKISQSIDMEFYFKNNGYHIDLVPTNDNRLIFGSEKSWFGGVFYPNSSSVELGHGHSESLLKQAQDPYSPYVREAVSRWRVYHFHDTSDSSVIKRRHASNDNLVLKPDAANLAPYLSMLSDKHPADYQRIVDTIKFVLPFFGQFVHRDDDYVELEWTQQGQPDTPFKASMLSDGSLRFICLATLLLQPEALLPSTILIDEPELGLHPYAISVLADIFKQTAESRQIIISTQSVELVNDMLPEDVIVVDQTDNGSTFTRYSQQDLGSWLEDYSLGELWKQNVLGGRP